MPNGLGWGRSSNLKGLGDGFMFRPKRVWIWVSLCLNSKGCEFGSKSRDKGVGFGIEVQT
ncbi:hypothetical protein NC652_008186 [Populus alba x Populus x berolinensis]|nr:hypothetical protein NC652_008186 [Populus alba x Populus x berolinensis]